MMMRAGLLVSSMLLAALPSVAAAADEDALLDVATQLMIEAERQHRVERQMGDAVEQFRSLVRDLEANDLVRRGQGEQLNEVADVLGTLSLENVPAAAGHLEQARQSIAALSPGLGGADEQVTLILDRLDDLVGRAAANAHSRDLLAEVQVLVEQERDVHEQTREWGREHLTDPEAAAARRPEIARRQQRLAEQARQVREQIDQARREAESPREQLRIRQAQRVMDQRQPERLLDDAAEAIDSDRPIPAAEAQTEAIAALEAVADALRPDERDSRYEQLQETRQQLEQTLEQQRELRRETETTPPDAFEPQRRELAMEQREIEDQLDELATEPEAVSDARASMTEAREQLDRGERDDATQAQREAEASLEQAIAELDEQLAQAQYQQHPDDAALAQVQQIQQEQARLEQETAARQQMDESVDDLAPPQQELGEQVEQAAALASNPQVDASLSEAQQAMERAASALASDRAEDARQMQAQAREALADAQQQLEADIAERQQWREQIAQLVQGLDEIDELTERQRELREQTAVSDEQSLPRLERRQEDLGYDTADLAERFAQAAEPLARARQAMDEAREALAEEDAEAAQPRQQQAERELEQAAQALEQSLMELMQPFDGPPMEALAQGEDAPPQPNPDPQGEQANEGPPPPDIGSAAGGRFDPEVDGGWSTLPDREREAIDQYFARELPAEYRELLEDYYETLAE
ncbi:MAG: hypothetical protein WD316_11220 [Phycisphaeraceae bacterium]